MNLFRNPLVEGRLHDPISAIGAGIGGIGSIVGGLLGSSASNKAANIQSQNAQRVAQMAQDAAGKASTGVNDAAGAATNAAIGGTTGANNTLSQLFGQQQQNLNPYLAAGQQGVMGLADAFAPGGQLTQQFQAPTAEEAANTPGYQFQLQQGLQALQRSAAAQGSLQGGGTLKGITQYAQGLASTNYQNAYNNAFNTFQTNHNNTLQGLQALTGVGQNANAQYNSASQNYGNQAASNLNNLGLYEGNNALQAAQYGGNAQMNAAQLAGQALTGGANAQAAGTVGSANAWQGAIGGVTNAAQFYGLQQALKPQGPVQSPMGFDPSAGSNIPAGYQWGGGY